MCGIVGWLYFDGAPPESAHLLEKMRDEMIHRGPDDSGIYTDGPCALAHRRLSIVDLAGGHQPMSNEDETIWTVYNGEIYNHAEIRARLEAKGHRFRTRCDTEVIVHAYEEYGEECVEHFRGMFAFAVWDSRRGRLFLARDRIGIKPLYFAICDHCLVFASEIKALLLHPSVQREPNWDALPVYLLTGVTAAPQTLFKGVQKLPAGWYLCCDTQGHHRQVQYWDAIVIASPRTEQEYVDAVREMLGESIRLRMMSDVPYGVFLSGGLDSSLNVALMTQHTTEPVRTFTVGFREQEKYNELPYARKVARLFGCEHHEVIIDSSDLQSYVPSLVYHQDEPIADSVCVPLYFVSKLLRDNGVIVVQVGEGSDEIFCGYTHYVERLRWYQSVHRWLGPLPAGLRRLALPAGMMVYKLTGRGAFRLPLLRHSALHRELFVTGHIFFDDETQRLLLSPDFWRWYAADGSDRFVSEICARFDREKPNADFLERMIYIDLKHRLPELLLMRIDKVTMSTSVEARVPYLDHRLVELVLPMPQRIKVRSGAKHVLKAAARSLLPDEIIHRPKQGFGAPVGKWFMEELRDSLIETLMDGALAGEGIFNRRYVEQLIAQNEQDGAHGSLLWNLYNLFHWYEKWIA